MCTTFSLNNLQIGPVISKMLEEDISILVTYLKVNRIFRQINQGLLKLSLFIWLVDLLNSILKGNHQTLVQDGCVVWATAQNVKSLCTWRHASDEKSFRSDGPRNYDVTFILWHFFFLARLVPVLCFQFLCLSPQGIVKIAWSKSMIMNYDVNTILKAPLFGP